VPALLQRQAYADDDADEFTTIRTRAKGQPA